MTNHWFNWPDGIKFVQSNDVQSYEAIARSAPSFPEKVMPNQHTQRFVIHYIVGLVSKYLNVPLVSTYNIFLSLILIMILFTLGKTFKRLGLDPASYIFAYGVFILNPYSIRYYLITPGMISDLVFVLGLAVTLYGFLSEKFTFFFFGALLALIGRQTAMVFVPAIVVWILIYKKYILEGLMTCVSLGVFYFFLSLAGKTLFVEADLISTNLFTIIEFMKGPGFKWASIGEHILRVLIPLFMPLCLIIGVFPTYFRAPPEKQRRSQWLGCLLMMGAVFAQPLLASPVVAGQNESRLSALGLVAVIFALAIMLKTMEPVFSKKFSMTHIVLFFVMVLASFHHLYSVIGPNTAFRFALIQMACAMVAGSSMYKSLQT